MRWLTPTPTWEVSKMAGFNHFGHQVLTTALQGATVKVMLLDSTANYTHSPEDEFVGDLPTGSEPSDASYSRQSIDDSASSFTQDDTDDEGVFDPPDVTFSGLSTSNDIEAVVVYAQDGFGSAGTDDTTAGDDPLIAVFDDDSGDGGGISDLPIATNGSDLQIQFNSEGLYKITTPT